MSVLQTVISGLVLFLLYRYLIDRLGAEQLGLWSVILASTTVARLSDMGLAGSVVKYVARYRALQDDIQASDVVQTAALSIAGVMAVLCIAVYPLLDNVLELALPRESMTKAMGILPWAIISLWLGSVGGVFQSGLDGCQRMVLRNILLIVGNVLFLVAAVWLVPSYGLVGLAIAQSAQAFLLMLVNWLALRRQLSSLPYFPINWSGAKFKEMFSYSINFQVSTIAILLFDPVTKLLMSRYGGLSSAAYYEMASQLVVKLRALLISANQALVPTVAMLYEKAPEKIRELYLNFYRIFFLVTVPFFSAIFISLPLVSELWIGHQEPQFIMFGTLLTIGWGLNSLTGPAYFINLGTGDLSFNSIAHVVMGILNLLLGLVLGPLFGGYGVGVSALVALTLASSIVLFLLHRKLQISFRDTLPPEHYKLVVAVFICLTISVWLNTIHWPIGLIWSCLFTLAIYLILISAVVWFHPYRLVFIESLHALRNK